MVITDMKHLWNSRALLLVGIAVVTYSTLGLNACSESDPCKADPVIVEEGKLRIVEASVDIRVVASSSATALGRSIESAAYISGGRILFDTHFVDGVYFDIVALQVLGVEKQCTLFARQGYMPLDGSTFDVPCAVTHFWTSSLTLRFEEDPSVQGAEVLGKSGRLVGEYRRDWDEPGVPSEVYAVEIHSFSPFYSPCVEGWGYPPLDAGVDP